MSDELAKEASGVNTDEQKSPGFFARIRAWAASHDGSGNNGVAVEAEILKVDKAFIMSVLPHRGNWLLLDTVEVTAEKVIGFFTVTDELCRGHAIGDKAVLPACLFPEFANQLTGVWYAIQNPELIGSGKIPFARTGDYKASLFIKPGDLLRIEVAYADLSGTLKTVRRGTFMDLSGSCFTFWVGSELMASVGKVVLKGVEPPKNSSSNKI